MLEDAKPSVLLSTAALPLAELAQHELSVILLDMAETQLALEHAAAANPTDSDRTTPLLPGTRLT